MLAKLNWSLSKVGSKFGQSWVKVQAKLNRSSSEVGSNLDRIWIECQLRSNFERNGLNFEQSRTRVAKEPNVLCIGAHIALQVGKRQSILWESYDNVYQPHDKVLKNSWRSILRVWAGRYWSRSQQTKSFNTRRFDPRISSVVQNLRKERDFIGQLQAGK